LILILALAVELFTALLLAWLFLRSKAVVHRARALHVVAQLESDVASKRLARLQYAASEGVAQHAPSRSMLASEAAVDSAIDALVDAKQNYRYLEAWEQLEALKAALAESRLTSHGSLSAPLERLSTLLRSDGVAELEERARTCQKALDAFNGDQSGWTLVSATDSMTMRRRDEPNKLIVKIDAVLNGVRPADTLMVWREGGLYSSWFPMISRSSVVHERHHAETVIHLVVQSFGQTLDLVLRGYGCDNLLSSGYFLLIVRPARQSEMPEGVTLPPKPGGLGMRVKADIDILVEPLSPTSVRFAYMITQKLPPHLAVPRWMINFVVQHGMGQIFSKMENVARGMAQNSVKSVHVAHVTRKEYLPTANWIRNRVDKGLSLAGHVE